MMDHNEETDQPYSDDFGEDTPERKPFFSITRAFQIVLTAALLVASLFTLFTPSNLFSGKIIDSMLLAEEETEQPVVENHSTPTTEVIIKHVGIVAGHWNDDENPGYVCSDGLTESSLNLQIATLVTEELTKRGYKVDLLEEHDDRLTQYKADALISIHNDTCDFISNDSTGFKVSPALANAYPENSNRLAQCLIDNYEAVTGLKYQTNQLTTDMTTYHSFTEVHSSTPAVVIETGYMNLDRQILTQNVNLIAEGVVEGIVCYLEYDPSQEATATP